MLFGPTLKNSRLVGNGKECFELSIPGWQEEQRSDIRDNNLIILKEAGD